MTAPTLTPAAPGASGGLTAWLGILVLLGYIGVLLWIAAGRPPLRASLLHAIMTGAQGSARVLGSLGLHAENAYRATVSPDGGAP